MTKYLILATIILVPVLFFKPSREAFIYCIAKVTAFLYMLVRAHWIVIKNYAPRRMVLPSLEEDR